MRLQILTSIKGGTRNGIDSEECLSADLLAERSELMTPFSRGITLFVENAPVQRAEKVSCCGMEQKAKAYYKCGNIAAHSPVIVLEQAINKHTAYPGVEREEVGEVDLDDLFQLER